jgi:Response regulator containing a CheY-like receiver domain and an HTH DNA-binding domain
MQDRGKRDPENKDLQMAANPLTPSAELERLANSSDSPIVLRYLADNENTPLEVLELLSYCPYAEVRAAIADNPIASLAILERLVNDEDPDVRLQIAENHNMPIVVLKKLEDDDNPYVSDRAERTLAKLFFDHPELMAPTICNELKPERPDTIRVLVVEDNDFIRSLMINALSNHYRIKVIEDVANGALGVQKVPETHPHVVLMDIQMPELNGIEATRIIKTQNPDVKVIMVTSCSADDDITEALQAGADGYYLKTSSLAALPTAITTVEDQGSWLDPGISSTVLRKVFKPSAKRASSNRANQLVDRMRMGGLVPEEEQEDNDALKLLKIEIDNLLKQNRIKDALAVCKAAAGIAVAIYGRKSPKAAAMLAQLAELHFMREDYMTSEKLFFEALSCREDMLDNADQETYELIYFLAKASEGRGTRQQAELYYAWCLRIAERMGDQQRCKLLRVKLKTMCDGSSRDE